MHHLRYHARRVFVLTVATAMLLTGAARADSIERSRLVELELSSSCISAAHAPRLRVNVWLPEGYNGRDRFPVLYLLHGLGSGHDAWLEESFGAFQAAVEDLPAIVVMPEAGVIPLYANSWNDGAREPCWEQYFLETLIPSIEDRFLVRSGRRWHAIGGFSSGGLGAVLYAARNPGYFGQVLSFSGVVSLQRPEVESDTASVLVQAIFAPQTLVTHGMRPLRDAFGDPVRQRFYWSGHNPPVLASTLAHSRLYVAHGGPTAPTCIDADHVNHRCAAQELVGGTTEANVNREWALDLVGAAKAAGTAVTYRPQQGGHWYGYSSRFLADAIENWGLFEPVPEGPSSWVYKTVSRSGEMWDLRFAFEAPPSTLQSFIRTDNRLRGTGRGIVRIRTAQGCEFDAALPFEIDLPAC